MEVQSVVAGRPPVIFLFVLSICEREWVVALPGEITVLPIYCDPFAYCVLPCDNRRWRLKARR